MPVSPGFVFGFMATVFYDPYTIEAPSPIATKIGCSVSCIQNPDCAGFVLKVSLAKPSVITDREKNFRTHSIKSKSHIIQSSAMQCFWTQSYYYQIKKHCLNFVVNVVVILLKVSGTILVSACLELEPTENSISSTQS